MGFFGPADGFRVFTRAFWMAGPGQVWADPPGACPTALGSIKDVARAFSGCRNDLEAAAVSLEPAIGEVLAALRDQPEALLVRMSGSGSACFAICADDRAAGALARRLTRDHPDWWVRPARLRGS